MTLKSDNGGCVKVYACVDGSLRIVKVDADWNIPDFAGWVEIDQNGSGSRGSRDAYAHAQKNYFPDGLTNPDGTHRYIYDPGSYPAYRKATAGELAAERAEIEAAKVPAGPTAEEKQLDLIQEIVEMRAQLAQIKINGGV